ncbi:MAG: YagK/YfjJ domain-containing protein [Desulfovibrio sp.]
MKNLKLTSEATFNGKPILNGDGEFRCYATLLQRIDDLMGYMTANHSRVTAVRFDLRYPPINTQTSNNDVSNLCKRLKENAKNQGIKLLLFWVREQSRAKHQHYHCIALLDGSKVRSEFNFMQVVDEMWQKVIKVQQPGLVHYCNFNETNRYEVMIQRPTATATGNKLEAQQRAFTNNYNTFFKRASYLAKEGQKGYAPRRRRNFGGSQMSRKKS